MRVKTRIQKFLLPVLLGCISLFTSFGAQSQPYVCVETNLGEFCMEMLEEDAPATVANFLKYVADGDYNNTFIHRTDTAYVVQGGGYKLEPLGEEVPQDAQIVNEFKLSNTRGTVAMAKLANEQDSATSEWFVNLTNNSATLDRSTGGFTVFAKVVNGMDVVDIIGNAQRVNLSGQMGDVFTQVPVLRKDEDGVGIEDFVQVLRVYGAESVEIDGDSPTEEETAEAQRYACTAEWIAEKAPTQACMSTNMGDFCINLFPDTAPLAVANFLHYVADDDYDNTFFHRSAVDFVVQGGGFKIKPFRGAVPVDAPVVNEFSRSNTRGTLAMAKLDGNPDSATSEWFVNLVDNAAMLDTQNGGFTVFGELSSEGMAIFDAINLLTRRDLSGMDPLGTQSAFGSVPLLRTGDATGGLSTADFVTITDAYIPGAGPNPCLTTQPEAVTEYANRGFNLPVRIDGRIYHIYFSQEAFIDEHVFTADLLRIIELQDIGQETATYTPADGLLVIPSVLVGPTVLNNVRLRLTNPKILQFTLEGYDQP